MAVIKLKQIDGLVYNDLKTLYLIENNDELTQLFRFDSNLSFNLLRTMIKEKTLTTNLNEILEGLFNSVICTKQKYADTYKGLDEHFAKQEKTKKYPKWYGKEKVEAEIKANGGVATTQQRGMLAINDLKNTWSQLNALGIKDTLGDTRVISDESWRVLIATVGIMQTKANQIIKESKIKKVK